MNVEAVVSVVAALGGIVAAVMQGWRRPRLRDEIEQDLRIVNALPGGDSSRAELLSSVRERVGRLLGANEARRDPSGMVLALIFVALAVFFTYQSMRGGWANAFWLLVAFFGIFGIFGFVESCMKAERDARGRRLGRGS